MGGRAEDRIMKSADDILNGLSFWISTERDAEALYRLASADDQVRQHALTLVLTNPNLVRVFARQPEIGNSRDRRGVAAIS